MFNPVCMQSLKSTQSRTYRHSLTGLWGRFWDGVLSVFDFGNAVGQFSPPALRDPAADKFNLESDWYSVGGDINKALEFHLKDIENRQINEQLAGKIERWKQVEEKRRKTIRPVAY